MPGRHLILFLFCALLVFLVRLQAGNWLEADDFYLHHEPKIRTDQKLYSKWRALSSELESADFALYAPDIPDVKKQTPELFLIILIYLSKYFALVVIFALFWTALLEALARLEKKVKRLKRVRQSLEALFVFLLCLATICVYWLNGINYLIIQCWHNDWTRSLNGRPQEMLSTLSWMQKVFLVPSLESFWSGEGFRGFLGPLFVGALLLISFVYCARYVLWIRHARSSVERESRQTSSRKSTACLSFDLFAVSSFLLTCIGTFLAHRFCGQLLTSYLAYSEDSTWGLTNVAETLSNVHFPAVFALCGILLTAIAMLLYKTSKNQGRNSKLRRLHCIGEVGLIWLLLFGAGTSAIVHQWSSVLEGGWDRNLTRQIDGTIFRWEEQNGSWQYLPCEVLIRPFRIDAFSKLNLNDDWRYWQGSTRIEYIEENVTIGRMFGLAARSATLYALLILLAAWGYRKLN